MKLNVGTLRFHSPNERILIQNNPYGMGHWRNRDIKLKRFINNSDLDVICLQKVDELFLKSLTDLIAGPKGKYGIRYAKHPNKDEGLAILFLKSRMLEKDFKFVDPNGGSSCYIELIDRLNNQTIRVANCDLEADIEFFTQAKKAKMRGREQLDFLLDQLEKPIVQKPYDEEEKGEEVLNVGCEQDADEPPPPYPVNNENIGTIIAGFFGDDQSVLEASDVENNKFTSLISRNYQFDKDFSSSTNEVPSFDRKYICARMSWIWVKCSPNILLLPINMNQDADMNPYRFLGTQLRDV